MSIIVLVRDYFDRIKPFFYNLDDSINQTVFLKDFLKSFLFFFESTITLSFSSFFSFQWLKDLVYFPILRPDIQIVRTNSRIFSITPLFSRDLFPKDLSFLRFTRMKFPTTAFQVGFFNAFFLALPRSLSFLVIFRRYWIQGFTAGLIRTLGYRIGETIFLLRATSGFGGSFWPYIGSPLPLVGSCLFTAFFLRDSYFHNRFLSQKPFFFFWQKKKNSQYQSNKKISTQGIYLNVRLIFFIHLAFSWIDQISLFNIFRNFTFNIQDFITAQSYFSFGPLVSFSYRVGLFLGGLFFDLCFIIIALRIREYFRRNLRIPKSNWKKIVNTWAGRFIIALSFRRIPFYGADYLSFSIFGFFGRDIELRQRVTRNVFSYPIIPGRPLSILFEGRNVIGEDSYGRPAPDILREPWQISRLALEVRQDLVEETYRTQQTNQRVDNIYLGVLEKKIFEWLALRTPESSSFSIENESPDTNQEKTTNLGKLSKKSSILVINPIRKGIGSDLTQKDVRFNYKIRERTQILVDRPLNRFDRWFRATRRITNTEDQSFFTLPIGRSIKVPENLFSLSTRGFSQQSYLSSIGILEPHRAIFYSNSKELSQKRNARCSPLHRGPILRYIDLLFKTRSSIDGFSTDISTRQQQRDLHNARIILHDYIMTARSYSESDRSSKIHHKTFSNRLTRRARWQRELYSHLFGGRRSRVSSVYSQQYLGNLQLVRRLFVVSWASQEIVIPYRLQMKENIILRRKISFDQISFDKQKNIFEHEELGKADPVKIQNGKDRNQVFNFSNISKSAHRKLGEWTLLSKKRYLQDHRIERKPLYVGWDKKHHSIVLCNRFLPIDWSVRSKVLNKQETKAKSYSSLLLSNLKQDRILHIEREFITWPKNFKTRRIRLQNVRYNRRAILYRRSFRQKNTSDVNLLSQDRRLWRRKAIGWDASIFSFWFNPRSDIYRENIGNSPIRTSQNFPLSLERRARPRTYVPGDLQPSIRGGLVWPGTDIFSYIPKRYYHPGSDRNFSNQLIFHFF
jgi:hypothetical protein